MKTEMSHSQRAFWEGARDTLPILVGTFPIGLLFGALALETGLTPLEAQGMSLFIFAGSAQFIAVDLIGRAAAPLVIVFAIFMVNLRHALYSATLAPHFAWLPRRTRAVIAWLLTDEAFAVTSTRLSSTSREDLQGYYLGSGLALWAAWQLSTAAGILFGARIPESWTLDFLLPLTFLVLLIPALTDRPAWVAAGSAAVLALLLHNLPYGMGLVLATVLAVGIGVAVESLSQPEAVDR